MEHKRSRGWCFTINNYTDDEYEAVTLWEASYLVVGKEVGDNLTPHLQGYVYYDNARTFASVKKLNPRMHLEPAKGDAKQNETYCSKSGVVFEKGTRPQTPKEKGENERDRCRRNLALCAKRKYAEMDPDIVAKQLRSYKYGAQHLREEEANVQNLEDIRGIHHEWHWSAEPHTGKSHYVERGSFYKHQGVKGWFDDYDFEDVVVMDDIDEEQRRSAALFKALLGNSAFRTEVKGSMIFIRPKHVRITSNLHPNQIWSGVHLAAILDRLGPRIYHWKHRYHLADNRTPNPEWEPAEGLDDDDEEPGPDWTEDPELI